MAEVTQRALRQNTELNGRVAALTEALQVSVEEDGLACMPLGRHWRPQGVDLVREEHYAILGGVSIPGSFFPGGRAHGGL